MKLLFKLLILIFLSTLVRSNETLEYNIVGNKRISDETIKNIVNLKKNKNYNIEDLNNFQKKLYETNYFKEVSIKIKKNKLNIIVAKTQ